MHISFKPIFDDDVDQLMDIALRTFASSYEHLNTPSNYKRYVETTFTTKKLISELQNEEIFYYFVYYKNQIAGYLKLNIGKSQTEKYSDDYLEIERIYLDDRFQKKGIGRKMMHFIFEEARRLSKSKIWLGVWAQNPNAILFYEHIGFRRSGTHIFKFGDEDQVDLIMEIDVSMI